MKQFFVLLAIFAIASASGFPEKFVGTWSVGKSENFDEYLSEKGYSWFTRQLVKASSITKTFENTATPGRINVKIETTTKNVQWLNVPFNEDFTGEYVDGGQHKIKFYEKDGKLYEDHVPIDTSGDAKAELYWYESESPNTIIMYMSVNGVTAKRWYNKQ